MHCGALHYALLLVGFSRCSISSQPLLSYRLLDYPHRPLTLTCTRAGQAVERRGRDIGALFNRKILDPGENHPTFCQLNCPALSHLIWSSWHRLYLGSNMRSCAFCVVPRCVALCSSMVLGTREQTWSGRPRLTPVCCLVWQCVICTRPHIDWLYSSHCA